MYFLLKERPLTKRLESPQTAAFTLRPLDYNSKQSGGNISTFRSNTLTPSSVQKGPLVN